MALTTCSKCGTKISSSAKTCPNCKAPMNRTKAACRTCNKLLDADDVYFSVSYVENGSTKSRLAQRDCPHCGEPKPFNVAAQVKTGGATDAIAATVGLLVFIGILIALFS